MWQSQSRVFRIEFANGDQTTIDYNRAQEVYFEYEPVWRLFARAMRHKYQWENQ